MASASVLCRFGHSCTEYSMPQTVVVTGMSMSLRNEYTDSAKRVLLAQVRQRDLVFLLGKAPVKVVKRGTLYQNLCMCRTRFVLTVGGAKLVKTFIYL